MRRRVELESCRARLLLLLRTARSCVLRLLQIIFATLLYSNPRDRGGSPFIFVRRFILITSYGCFYGCAKC